MLALALVLVFLGMSTPLPMGWLSWHEQAIQAIQPAGFVGAPLLGGLIASRRPQNPYGWLWLVLSLGFSLAGLAWTYAAYALVAEPGSLPAPRTVGTGVAMLGWSVGLTCLPLLLLLFPDGRPPSRRWRFVVWADVAVGAVLLIVILFTPGQSAFNTPVKNPLGIGGVAGDAIATIASAMAYVLFATVFLSALSLVIRYHRARGVERQQLKWFALAAALVGASVVADTQLRLDKLLGSVLVSLFDSATLAALYVAVGVAILRYRLYDIDVLINRALVYGSLTVMLALVYIGGVTTTEAIFRALSGQEKQTQIAVVASTLVIAALFTPLRRRIQSFIDRRFYRSKYDARKTLEAFSAKLRDETDLEALNEDLVGVVKETMQPAHVSLWLHPESAPKGGRAT
jgi:hypothetical protein